MTQQTLAGFERIRQDDASSTSFLAKWSSGAVAAAVRTDRAGLSKGGSGEGGSAAGAVGADAANLSAAAVVSTSRIRRWRKPCMTRAAMRGFARIDLGREPAPMRRRFANSATSGETQAGRGAVQGGEPAPA